MSERYDIAVIGAGMAGASIAAECADHARVVMLEAEDAPGLHTTGRSAAFWEELYGGPSMVPLTQASRPYLDAGQFLADRGALYIARDSEEEKLERFAQRYDGTGASFERIGRAEMERRLPGLAPQWTHAIWQPECQDIDVAALHQHYLSTAKRSGADLRCSSRLVSARRSGGEWEIGLEKGATLRAGVIVNAAGAWAGEIAEMAGAQEIGIQPLRRTMAVLRTKPEAPPCMPLTIDISGQFYFRPDNGRLWLSPHDETPSEPCDAAADELDVAQAIDRLADVLDWKVDKVERKWAGLRSFTPDRLPVYGFDGQADGFFWFAGQGGTGIQTAPAAARLGAQLLFGQGRDQMTERLEAEAFDPGRFCPSP